MKLSYLAGFTVLALATPAFATTYDIDPMHSSVGFMVKHMVISKVRGTFHDVSGTLDWDEKDATKSTVNITLNTGSIDTGVQKRDDDLRSAKFFDATAHPKITFKSTKIKKDGKGFKVTGDLTIRDKTLPVTLTVEGPAAPIKDPFGFTRTAVSATGKINRRDFGLLYDDKIETGGLIVGNEVELEISAEFTHKDAPKT